MRTGRRPRLSTCLEGATGGGGPGKDSISVAEGAREATGEAGGEGSDCSDGVADPNRAPDKEEACLLDMFSG